jgi:hypothetical protein
VTPRGTDWSLALLVAAGVTTGLATWFAGAPGSTWVFAGHAIAGASLVFVLVVKLRRVLPRLAPASAATSPTAAAPARARAAGATFVASLRLAPASYPAAVDVRQLRGLVESVI